MKKTVKINILIFALFYFGTANGNLLSDFDCNIVASWADSGAGIK